MADTLPYIARPWHDREIYFCPVCGTSRSTIPFIERHMHDMGHTTVPEETAAAQAEAVAAGEEVSS